MDFDDTKTAFRNRTTNELGSALRLFNGFKKQLRSRAWRAFKILAARFFLWLRLPVKRPIRRMGFDHFYGGETLDEAIATMSRLRADGVRSILEYSVEAVKTNKGLNASRDEVLRAVEATNNHPGLSFAVFKVTGIAQVSALEAASVEVSRLAVADSLFTSDLRLGPRYVEELSAGRARMHAICSASHVSGVRILVDAEHSWVQPAIDWLTLQMMLEFNHENAIVYNTFQCYRVGRLDYLKEVHRLGREHGFIPGIKLVRGAYMVQERRRAAKQQIPSPIQPDQAATDEAYNAALDYCVEHIDELAMFVGTHNLTSLQFLADLLTKRGIQKNDPRVEIAQLLGMCDNASAVLAISGYNVSKWIPYGPLRESFPYLDRRAQENTAIVGDMHRERQILIKEIERRRGRVP